MELKKKTLNTKQERTKRESNVRVAQEAGRLNDSTRLQLEQQRKRLSMILFLSNLQYVSELTPSVLDDVYVRTLQQSGFLDMLVRNGSVTYDQLCRQQDVLALVLHKQSEMKEKCPFVMVDNSKTGRTELVTREPLML